MPKLDFSGITDATFEEFCSHLLDRLGLCCLHDAFQAVMGWTDSHLHQFEKHGKYWGVPEHYEEDDIEVIDENRVPVGKVLLAEGDSMVHVYDFGDDWRHKVVLKSILPAENHNEAGLPCR